MSRTPLPLEEYKALIGEEVGTSDWILIDQARIDSFADATLDHQFIHVDPERARSSQFGGTIAHGFLSLSLLSGMSYQAVPPLARTEIGVNYGFNSVRFLTPVRSSERVRGRFSLRDLVERQTGGIVFTYDVTVEIEGRDKPALVAQWLSLWFLE